MSPIQNAKLRGTSSVGHWRVLGLLLLAVLVGCGEAPTAPPTRGGSSGSGGTGGSVGSGGAGGSSGSGGDKDHGTSSGGDGKPNPYDDKTKPPDKDELEDGLIDDDSDVLE